MSAQEETVKEEVDWLVDLTKDIVESLVDDSRDVNIKTRVKGRILLITISSKNEIGKVIGRKGRTINALRVLLRALGGGQKRLRVVVETIR